MARRLPIRCAVVGLRQTGSLGTPNYLAGAPLAELVACNLEREPRYGSALGSRFTTSLDRLLSEPELDAVR